MKLVLALLAGLAILGGNAQAQQPAYDQAQLDAMLAPIALQSDGIVSQVLIAATYPDEVAAAAGWARANPHMRGDAALRAVENEPWDPAVKALVAFPELLIRMDESPQWMRDLGQAFIEQQAQVMDTVQALRRRAQAAGNLSSTDQYSVSQEGEAIVVQPRSQIVYVPYYDPFVVYGSWWWPHYYPVYWRPWVPRPVFLAHGFWYAKPHWHSHHVQVVHRPVHVRPHHSQHVVPGKWNKHAPHVVSKSHGFSKPHVVSKPYVRVPESQRQPIVRQPMPAASGFTQRQPPRVQAAPVRQQRSAAQERSAVQERSVGQARGSVPARSFGQTRSFGETPSVGQTRNFGKEGSFGRQGGGQQRGGGNGGGFRGRG